MSEHSLWYPCTQMASLEDIPPIEIASAKGIFLYPKQGKPLMDMISSWWVNLHGHCHPEINQAITQQLNTLEHTMLAGLTHQPIEQLAEKLLHVSAPHLKKVFFADSGSGAIEIALKMSLQAWHQQGETQRHIFISLENGYHGETLGSLSVTDIPLFSRQYAPLMVKQLRTPTPDLTLKPDYQTEEAFISAKLLAFEHLLQQYQQQVCAVIVEPLVQGASGMKMYPVSYLYGLESLAKKYHIHVIYDEIAVGFGRTGNLFVSEGYALQPDFVCLSKGLTAGYLPMSAVLTTNEIYQAFYSKDISKGFLHSHSYTGNPLSAVAGLASLQLFDKNKVIEKNKLLIEAIHQGLLLLQSLDCIKHTRQTGMIGAFSLFNQSEPFGQQTMREFVIGMQQQGFWIRPIGHHVYIIPPYCITTEQIQAFFQTSLTVLKHLPKDSRRSSIILLA